MKTFLYAFFFLFTLTAHAASAPGIFNDRFYVNPDAFFPSIQDVPRNAEVRINRKGNAVSVRLLTSGAVCRYEFSAGKLNPEMFDSGSLEFWTDVVGSDRCVQSGKGRALVSTKMDGHGNVFEIQILIRTAHMHTREIFKSNW